MLILAIINQFLLILAKVFWVVMLCSVVVGSQHFGGPCFTLKIEEAWIF
jgi:hypothetical protein